MVDICELYTAVDLPDEKERVTLQWLNPKEFVQYNAMHNTDAGYAASDDQIKRVVLGTGMMVSKCKGKWKANPLLQKTFDNQWICFLKNVQDQLSMYGLSFVDVRPDGIPFVRFPQDMKASQRLSCALLSRALV